jgi:hypothetical protein
MDINKFINTNYTGKDITGLKLNEDVLTNVIYKIKQKIKDVKNFEQLDSYVRIIINDLNVKDKELIIDKINKFLYNELYIDIDIVALRKNIIENFNDTDQCPNTATIICPIDTFDRNYNCASSNYSSNGRFNGINSDNNLYPNPWYSAYSKNNKNQCTVDTSQCPPGLTLGKNNDGSNVCIHEKNEYATDLNLYAENKWYQWFTIPNYHLDNQFIEIKGADNKPMLLDPCGCTRGQYEFDKIPYTEVINKCMSKMDYKFGAYTDAMPFSPIAAICLFGVLIDSNLLEDYHSNLYVKHVGDVAISYDTDFIKEGEERLIITNATRDIKEIGCQFIMSEYTVSIPNSYELPKSIYAFDVEKIAFAYKIASNVSRILGSKNGYDKLKNHFDYTFEDALSDIPDGINNKIYEMKKNYEGYKKKKISQPAIADELIKACKICFSLRFNIDINTKTNDGDNVAKGLENFLTMEYIYDLFSNKTNMFAVEVVNKLQMEYPNKGYLTFDITPKDATSNIQINETSMYGEYHLRTDIPSSVNIPFKYNKSLSNVISFTKTFLVYLFMLFIIISILYLLYLLWTEYLYEHTFGIFDQTVVKDEYAQTANEICIEPTEN